MFKYNAKYLPPYIVPDKPDLSRIAEPNMYPSPPVLLPDARKNRAMLEAWKLIDVSWNIADRPKTNLSRYYFAYIEASRNITVPEKRCFTGYALFETRYEKEIHSYAEPEEMWCIDKWRTKGCFLTRAKTILRLNYCCDTGII